MAEQTLNSQLSGAEIIEAICDQVRTKLRKDCNLNQNSAYDFFKARVMIDATLHDTGTDVKVQAVTEQTFGKEPAGEEGVEHHTTKLEIDKASPNEVRVETGHDRGCLLHVARDAVDAGVLAGDHLVREEGRHE